MDYQLNIEETSDISRKLHFIVAADEVRTELDKAFHDLKRKVRLPGFRPGKVPRNMLEARYGQQIRGEVSGRLIEASYREAVGELPVTGRPEVEARGEVKRDTDLTFTITVQVRPEISVKGHDGVAIELVKVHVTDADVTRMIDQRRSTQARIEEVKDERPVTEGDLVVVKLTLTKDGEELANEPGTMVHTTHEQYYPGVETMLIGLKTGEHAEGEVTIGADAQFEHLAGVTCTAAMEVVSIQAHVVPELDDALAEELGFEGGVDGMTAAIRAELGGYASENRMGQARVKILERLVESNKFSIPDGMIDDQMGALVDELRMRRSYAGQDPKDLRLSDNQMSDLRTRAEFAARASCILQGVARQEGIEVSDEDVNAKVAEIAEARGQAVEAVLAMVAKEGADEMLRSRIQEEKTIEWLYARANVTEVDASTEIAAPAASAASADAPEWNAKMKKDELLAVAKQMGLTVNTKMKKADIVTALEGA
jgi:trigger factor